VSGQLQDASSHHQTHLDHTIGQSGKKEAANTFVLSTIRTHCKFNVLEWKFILYTHQVIYIYDRILITPEHVPVFLQGEKGEKMSLSTIST